MTISIQYQTMMMEIFHNVVDAQQLRDLAFLAALQMIRHTLSVAHASIKCLEMLGRYRCSACCVTAGVAICCGAVQHLGDCYHWISIGSCNCRLQCLGLICLRSRHWRRICTTIPKASTTCGCSACRNWMQMR